MMMFKRFFVCFLLSLALASCSNSRSTRNEDFQKWTEDNGKIKALATTAMINDVVKQIGGDRVDSIALIQGELDPHSYQLVKGDDEKLSFAQLIFSNGLELEHGPSLQRYLRRNPKNVSLGGFLEEQDPQAIIEVNGQKDPHIWMDVSLWARAIPTIVDALSRQDPERRAFFEANAARLQANMKDAHARIKNLMHEIPSSKRYLVTSHDAFNYFTRAYLAEEEELAKNDWQKRFAAPEGLAPESQLSATDIRMIIDHMADYKIQVLFPESNVSRDSIRKIVQAGREKGLDLIIACCPLYADAMGAAGSEGDTYLKMMVYNAEMIASYLKQNGLNNSQENKIH